MITGRFELPIVEWRSTVLPIKLSDHNIQKIIERISGFEHWSNKSWVCCATFTPKRYIYMIDWYSYNFCKFIVSQPFALIDTDTDSDSNCSYHENCKYVS